MKGRADLGGNAVSVEIKTWDNDRVILSPESFGTVCLRLEQGSIVWLTSDQAGELAAVLLRFHETGEVG